MITLTLNGKPKQLDQPIQLSRLIESLQLRAQFIVVERNGEIVPRETFDRVTLQDGDVLEIVHMVGGGAS